MNYLERLAPILFLLMWSSGAIFVKMGLENASVWSFLTLRATGAFLLMGVIYLCFKINRKTKLTPSILARVVVTGLLLQVFYQAFYFLSIRYELSPGLVSIVLGLQPIMTILFGGDKASPYKLLILLIGFSGLGLAIFGAKDVSQVTPLGVSFAILSVMAISIGSLFQKTIPMTPLESGMLQNGCASIVFVATSLIIGWHVNWSPNFVFSLSWMIVVVSTGAVLLLFYMIQRNSASKVSVLFYLVPILTMFFDFIIFDTEITTTTIMGALIVIASIKLFSLPSRRTSEKMLS
ncbi:DMT family transporter [Aeromonas media]|uniref:DMT family transporter n=1 Tax=Aeromonas media TaxID=651 RepID=UPI003D0528BA